MWAQQYKDCFPGYIDKEPEANPTPEGQKRIQIGRYLVPPSMVEEYRKRVEAESKVADQRSNEPISSSGPKQFLS